IREAPPERRPEILEFSPWQVVDQEQLAAVFFQEIGKVLGRGDRQQEQTKLAAKWDVYTRALTAAGQLATPVPNVFAASLLVLAIFPFLASFVAVGTVRAVLVTTWATLAIISVALKWGSKFASSVSEFYKAKSETAKR